MFNVFGQHKASCGSKYAGPFRKSSTLSGNATALGAIQGLNQKLKEELQRRDAENAKLNERLAIAVPTTATRSFDIYNQCEISQSGLDGPCVAGANAIPFEKHGLLAIKEAVLSVRLFYTGPIVNTEMLLVMLERHGIVATQEFVDPDLPDEGDLNRLAKVFVPEGDYDRAHGLFYSEREDEL
jgi:hypothetical protein